MPLNLLIKPASGNCNLRCRYCFYHDEQQKRDVSSFGMMSAETLEAIIKKALAHARGSCSFGFQGGEPTLAGLDFFRRAVALQKQYNTNGLTVHNAIQTNGTLLSDEWAAFFAENGFLVGLSLDGDARLHNLYRRDADGRETFGRVWGAAKLLEKHKADFNVLTVVTAQTARRIADIYAFFMRSGLYYQQYIPCLDPLGEARGQEKYSLTPALYGQFLKKLFDAWYRDRAAGRFVYIRYFENLAGMLRGIPPESCGLSGVCSMQYAFEADGGVYPCDFYMLDAYRLGNICTDDFPAIDQRRADIGFVRASLRLPETCRRCRFASLCRGGCMRDRDETGRNAFCEAYQSFFAYALPRLSELAGGS